MNRLTRVEGLSTLIKDGWKKKDTEKNYTSICYGCEEIRKCVNKCGFCKALDKLAEYEDLEEQGLLIKLPCKVGDDVYLIHNICNGKWTKIEKVKFGISLYNYFGKTVFLTREEAEKALKESEEK